MQRLIPTLGAAALLCACSATPLSPVDRAELDARTTLDAELGRRIGLFGDVPSRMLGRMGTDGRAHLWLIDRERALHHVEVDPAGTVSTERLGSVGEDVASMAFDAVESLPGTWRVLAGSSQFSSMRRGAPWREVAGNRCRRFVRVGDRLLCGFVMGGEELGTPTRTDVYAGIFVIVPFAIPVHRQARKLVLAEAVGDSWVVRTVLDPGDTLDADPGFLLGADDAGNVQVVYFVGRGGALLLIGPGVAGGMASSTPRHARVEAASLPRASPPEAPQGTGHPAGVDGRPIVAPQWMAGYGAAWPIANLAMDPASGLVEGLMNSYASSHPPIAFRGRKVRIDGMLDIELRQGAWQPLGQIVVLADWPRNDADYHLPIGQTAVAFDGRGGLHALLPFCTAGGFWTRCVGGISYLVKTNGRWSRPLTVGGPYTHGDLLRVIPGMRHSLVTWAAHGAGLAGQWVVFRDADTR